MHMCVLTMAISNEVGYELFLHPPSSPDFSFSDFFLFPNLKQLGGKRFGSNNKVIAQTNAYFEDLDKSYDWEVVQKFKKF